MLPLNVSFGIYAFLPMGWLFMAGIILGEAFLMSRYLVRKKFDKKIYLSATVSNIISGAVGIISTLALNGGWWLVVWFPWVSSHEVDIHSRQAALALVILEIPKETDPLVLKRESQTECRLERFFILSACISILDEKKSKGGSITCGQGGSLYCGFSSRAKTLITNLIEL